MSAQRGRAGPQVGPQSRAFSHKQDEIKGGGGSFLEEGGKVEADVGRWEEDGTIARIPH